MGANTQADEGSGGTRGRVGGDGKREGPLKIFGIQVIISCVSIVALKMGVLAIRFGTHTYRKQWNSCLTRTLA